jgi:4-hydroxy-2-oxoheptanedioate aldolase
MKPRNDPSVPFVERLRRGEELVGLIVKMPNHAVLEVAGHLGFDFALIDTEHGAEGTLELENHLRAADSAGLDVVVRVGANDPLPVLRALDAGATGVVVPHVDTPADAEHAVRSAHYPPVGARGLAASTRAGRFSTGTLADHLNRSRSETAVIVQIEDRKAVESAYKIAATDHVDAVWLGPGDLSMSIGYPGDLSHPHVAAAIDSIVDDVNRAADTALCVVLDNESEIPAWRTRGATVFLFVAANLQTERLRDLRGRTRLHGQPAHPQVVAER